MAERAELIAGDAREIAASERLIDWVATVDHKQIGILYLCAVLFFFAIGGVEALLIRSQLTFPEENVLGPDAYNQVFTMHGTTMIFLAVMPVLIGLANYVVPLQIGARDMAFPRLNALSFWLFFFGGLLLQFSFVGGGAPNTGWFSYAPLTEHMYNTSPGVDYWALGLIVTSVGTIAASINLIVTIFAMRAPGMALTKVPLFVWTVLINSFIILWAIPSLTAAQIMLLFDRQLGSGFFDVQAGGDAVMWQHLFWFFGHPEVYIMILPVFGMISEIVSVFSRKPVFGAGYFAGSTLAIAFLSFSVWAHHMFAVGMGNTADAVFAGASMLIAVPTGVKVFTWLATMWRGTIRLVTPMLFAMAFVGQFVIGGLTGPMLATVPIDWQVEDTYFVVAHFHYVLFGGSAFGIFAGLYYWFPKMTGRMLSERWGKWNFWLMFVGFNLTFFPMHILGLIGMPRRVYTYPAGLGWDTWNLLSSVGTVILAAGILAFLWNVFVSLRSGEIAGDDPWDAWTLEWSTPSPPPPYNFAEIPTVRSRRPLWDRKHPEDPDWRHGG